jgi:hypothetical protein
LQLATGGHARLQPPLPVCRIRVRPWPDLSLTRPRAARLCTDHMRADELDINGAVSRFCQKNIPFALRRY